MNESTSTSYHRVLQMPLVAAKLSIFQQSKVYKFSTGSNLDDKLISE
jgi:hypothetical protein